MDSSTVNQSSHTVGIFIFPNGDKYEGEYVILDGGVIERQGYGKHTCASTGICYEGTWLNDMLNGEGSYTHKLGAIYEGHFKNNKFHGAGKYSWPDGMSCVGQFVENRLQGKGQFYDQEGHSWVGTFRGKVAAGLQLHLQV
ncbi:PREDICTED: MORN repeat-containing protein 2-like [Priapulus caudatus]|uniref:MORN repeat-containing protein 2-like n=1 Tax=Priapulus caudatus TaxID=37621 RepID=A0ABM1EDI2_PRICU|nr:PREDICTED: MORN repeat-containing protein 2-like [Priapulus caudatus]